MVDPTSGTALPHVDIAPDPSATAQAQLDVLVANPKFAESFFAGDVAARQQFADLTSIIAGADDVKAAMEGAATPPALFEITTGKELPARARADAVESLRGSGISDGAIEQALKGTPVSRHEMEMARRYQGARHADKEFVDKLLSGDIAARREQMLLSIILSSEIAE
jgi:hypothetical protein